MLTVISPAKTLDYESPLPVGLAPTRPDFLADSAELIDILREYSPSQVASLMSLSDKLAALNVARFQSWQPDYAEPDARPALFAFKGDVYTGHDVERLLATELEITEGKITGKLRGKNCHGEEKVARIKAAYDLSKFENIFCYGDSEGDKPMLALATQAHYKPFV